MLKLFWLISLIVTLVIYGGNWVAAFTKSSKTTATSLSSVITAEKAAAETSIPSSDETENASEETTMNELDSPPGSPETPKRTPGVVLFDFAGDEPGWYTVNDDVMGGVSTSIVNVDTDMQKLNFSGNVSLENNGGFASIRSQWAPYNLGRFDGILMRVRGDGNIYQFRIRTEETGPQISYTGVFETKAGIWQEVFIPFSKMVPLFRGFIVDEAGTLAPATIRSFGMMVTDKQEGNFSLEVDWINAVALDDKELTYASARAEN
jgi:monofunctional biosynthetic peptidoglycan transglycosylase